MNLRSMMALVGFVLLAPWCVANAFPIALSGLTFIELSPDVEITGGVAGAGTQADPIVLFETVSGLDVTLQIFGLSAFGNPTGSGHTNAFWIRKVVTNDTGVTWTFYDHELQSVLGVPSTDGDGLSFAQDCLTCRPWTSDVFTDFNEIIDVRDFINFSKGSVADGETVIFDFIISDNASNNPFYLRQRPNLEVVPEPTTAALLAFGLVGIAARRRARAR